MMGSVPPADLDQAVLAQADLEAQKGRSNQTAIKRRRGFKWDPLTLRRTLTWAKVSCMTAFLPK